MATFLIDGRICETHGAFALGSATHASHIRWFVRCPIGLWYGPVIAYFKQPEQLVG
jgi:hypothetical protein